MQQLNLSNNLRKASAAPASPRPPRETSLDTSSYFDIFCTECLPQLRECRNERDALRQISTSIAQQNYLLGFWLFNLGEDGSGQSISLIDSEANSLWQVEPALQECCARSLQTKRSTQVNCSRLNDHVAIAVPIPPEAVQQVFCGLVSVQQANSPEALAKARGLLELASHCLMLWRSWFMQRQSENFSRNAAAVMSVTSAMSHKIDLPGASLVLVNHFRDLLDCHRVAIVFRDNAQSEFKILAVSGTDSFDQHSPITVLMQTVSRNACKGDEPAVWSRTPAGSETGESTIHLALRQLADHLRSDCTIVVPTTDCQGQPNGCLIVAGEKQLADKAATLCSTKLFGNMIGSQLDLLNQAHASTITRTSGAVVRFVRSNLGRVILAVAAAIFVAMLVPLPHKIKSDCVIEPVSRRFIAAPFDGKLEQTLVEPGDLVRQGDLLARLDGSEIRMQLSALRAEYDRESKHCDAALSSGNIAESQIARHEMEKIALDISLKEKRIGNLEIQSPIDGMVVSGDLKQVVGAPLTVGQSMYEIAPLEELIVEVFIPEEEIGYVEQGMQVSLRTDAFPLSAFTGTIKRIHPRSEMRNEQSVFVAELVLDNPDASLRPGMNGTAKVSGQYRLFGWILFHKVWEKVIFQFGL